MLNVGHDQLYRATSFPSARLVCACNCVDFSDGAVGSELAKMKRGLNTSNAAGSNVRAPMRQATIENVSSQPKK